MMIKKLSLLWLACVSLVLAADPATAPVRHAITHEDLWLMKRVGAPVPSPDGKWVVFTVVEPAYEAKEQWSDLWMKSLTDDTPVRRLTYSKGGEGGVNWSPDSRKIAFSAKREGDEVPQIYVLDLSGGEAERVTNLTLGAGSPKWSPDGKTLLFVSQVYPGAMDEAANKRAAKHHKERKYNVRAYEQFPARFWNQWLDDRKAHLFVQEARSDAPARDLLAGTKFAALPRLWRVQRRGRPEPRGGMDARRQRRGVHGLDQSRRGGARSDFGANFPGRPGRRRAAAAHP